MRSKIIDTKLTLAVFRKFDVALDSLKNRKM